MEGGREGIEEEEEEKLYMDLGGLGREGRGFDWGGCGDGKGGRH